MFVVAFSNRRRGEVEGGYHYGGNGRVNLSFFDGGDGLEPRLEGVRTLETLSFCFSGFRYLRSTEDFSEATDLVSALP